METPKSYLYDDNIKQTIIELYEQGLSKKAISEQLDLTYRQVVYFYKKYTLRKDYFWLSKLDKIFIQDNLNLTNKQLGKILKRNEFTISRYRKKPHYLSDKEKNLIKTNSHLSAYRLGKILNRSRYHIQKLKKTLL